MDSFAQITIDAATCAKKTSHQEGSLTATSQTDTECSAPTSSTFDDDRCQARSLVGDTAPTTPDQNNESADDRQPPSPLAADKFPLVPCLTGRPEVAEDDDGGTEEATKTVGRVDGILVDPEHRHDHNQSKNQHHSQQQQQQRRRRRRRHNVTFTTLTVHHHPPTLSDHPAVSDAGPPLGLAWSSTHVTTHDVDEYEYDRQMAGNERRTTQQLRMSGDKRRMLLRRAGHTDEELEEMMAEVKRVQTNRARTAVGGGVSGILLDMGSKTRMVRNVGSKAKRQVGKVVVAMDKATTIRIQPVGRAVLEFGDSEERRSQLDTQQPLVG